MSKEALILTIIQAALVGLQANPTTAGAAAIASPFFTIFMNGLTLYHQETGQPLDLTKIPLETPVN